MELPLNTAKREQASDGVKSQRVPDRTEVAKNLLIGLIAFLTVVDLFATQAILPSLRVHYDVTPAAMSVAVNASTIGMAIAGLLTALFSGRINRRSGIVASLAILAVPTLLLAHAPDLGTFTVLRIVQGLCMATAFTLTLAHLGESAMSHEQASSAFAAYITGNVASNLVGRILSSGLADGFGLSFNFYAFAALNLAGAVLAAITIRSATSSDPKSHATTVRVADLLCNPTLRAAFMIGFCILFVFIGVFTYVNFVLVRTPLSVAPMAIGLVYFVFIPSIITTPLAGNAVSRFGTRRVLFMSLAVAGLGLPLIMLPYLVAVVPGLALVAIGTFFAQAAATGFVSRAAPEARATASGLYLASYFTGGLVGTALLGFLFDTYGWNACVAGIGTALLLAGYLARNLVETVSPSAR
jgi:MFS transporter, YNFM family, putative membrane transport protein